LNAFCGFIHLNAERQPLAISSEKYQEKFEKKRLTKDEEEKKRRKENVKNRKQE
jgi:hypothetical protein